MYILDKIVNYKREEISRHKAEAPISKLEKSKYFERQPHSFGQALQDTASPGIISEYKRRSPSKPKINLTAKADEVIKAYEENGATAISCLTDQHFFGGKNDFLSAGREEVSLPILRKDFTIDEYQIIEAKAVGADAILLIAEVLTKQEIKAFTATAHNLGLNVLLELHHENELSKIDINVDVIGINNRDLRTFKVDFDHSRMMFQRLPSEIVKISESGISDPEVVASLWEEGYKGFLIGETFMKTENPGKTCGEFIAEINALLS